MIPPRLAAVLAMAAAGLYAAQSAQQGTVTQKATVIVCMESDPHALQGVRPVTAATFARIGVRIVWHALDACPVGADAIQVRLSRDPATVRASSSEALAATQLYARRVTVFPERVEELSHNWGISMMSNVLVHEITHVLEGIDRHSSTGVMKARWDDKDYFAMRSKPPDFAPEDLILIYAGLKIPRAPEGTVAPQ